MTGIEFFLTKQIYGPEQHPHGWDKYVYDDENIHYALLQLLSESCPAFAQKLLGLSESPERVSVFPKPKRGLFDLQFTADDMIIFCEVKVWASLSEDQFLRQTTFLKEQNAKGIYVLFTKAADAWPSTVVLERSEGRCRVVGVQELSDALGAVETEIPAEVAEVAAAYRSVLKSIGARRW